MSTPIDNIYLLVHYASMNYDDHLKEWDDRRAVMAKLKRQGISVRDIATRYGISTQRCYQILKNGQKQATVAIPKDKQNVGKSYTKKGLK